MVPRSSRAPGLDTGVLLAVLALLAIGLPTIYSASHVTDGAAKLVKQLIWLVVGLGGMGALACVDYRSLQRYWRLFYLITLVALLATLFLAREINGARSWIDLGPLRLQPSEFAKFLLILAFASLLARVGPRVQALPVFLRCLAYLGVPILLVLVQPDFGTAMVLCGIWFVMVLAAGARWWMLAGVVVGGALLFGLAWQTNLIKPYQKQRLDFIHADPAGNGYHQRQARIAIGAGELWGKGYLHGTQARRGFLPEQDTDFVYAVIGEEFGFLGGVVVLALYLVILFRLLRVAAEAETVFARLVTAGVAAMLGVHVIVNIGMCLTLSPVTGVPLPFISYGGSNLLANLLALGVVLNISRHRRALRAWASSEELVQL